MTSTRKQTWTDAERATLHAQYPHIRTADIASALGISVQLVYSMAMRLGLRKSEAFASSDKSGRIFKGGKLGQLTQFATGQVPWNFGKNYEAGGRSIETRFKKGQRSSAAQALWVPVGTYRINSKGILDQKITDLGRGPRDWEAMHRLVWKAANGPIPSGHVVAFKPGRKTAVLKDITLDAVECITRRELMWRNSVWQKNPDIAHLYHLKSAINRQVNRIKKETSSV